jgi:hypothetical protein
MRGRAALPRAGPQGDPGRSAARRAGGPTRRVRGSTGDVAIDDETGSTVAMASRRQLSAEPPDFDLPVRVRFAEPAST